MIKKCKVILNNDAVTVARFDNINVQFPSIHKKEEFVNVLYKDGKYKIVDSDYVEDTPMAKNNDKKRRVRATNKAPYNISLTSEKEASD